MIYDIRVWLSYFIYILVEKDMLKVSSNEETKEIDATALSKSRKRIIFILLVNHTTYPGQQK